jgi:hypothetical protein
MGKFRIHITTYKFGWVWGSRKFFIEKKFWLRELDPAGRDQRSRDAGL